MGEQGRAAPAWIGFQRLITASTVEQRGSTQHHIRIHRHTDTHTHPVPKQEEFYNVKYVYIMKPLDNSFRNL